VTGVKSAKIRTLIELSIPSSSRKDFTLITDIQYRKIDYLRKAKENSINGLEGERLVMEFERDRLTSLGYPQLASKIQWISRESDQFGCDIISYDVCKNGSANQIYIEVKSTTLKKDCPFFVSVNEIEFSHKKSQTFWLYRVYDLYNENPKLYRVQGPITKSFRVRPYSYCAQII